MLLYHYKTCINKFPMLLNAMERNRVSAKYSCGFHDSLIFHIIVVDRYLDYFITITKDTPHKARVPIEDQIRLINETARAAWQMLTGVFKAASQ